MRFFLLLLPTTGTGWGVMLVVPDKSSTMLYETIAEEGSDKILGMFEDVMRS